MTGVSEQASRRDSVSDLEDHRRVALLEALRLPRQGRVFELGTVLGTTMPQGPSDTFGGFRLTPYRTPHCLTMAEPPGFDFSMELISGSPHVGTHFDGLAHIQSFGKVHGGHSARDAFDAFGWRVNGLEAAEPVVSRGVLLDVAAALGGAHLPDRYEISPDDLRRTLELK